MQDQGVSEGREGVRRSAVFPARMAAFQDVAAFVDEVCGMAGCNRDDRFRLTLVLEELFTNTVVHGHHGDSDATVRVTLEARPGRIGVTYEDEAPPFDPFTTALEPSAAVEQRPVGGLGLVLVARMTGERTYARTGGRNCVSLVLAPSA
jgi:anti-sigma regulatory factor (Ser/Thr protein kinase)